LCLIFSYSLFAQSDYEIVQAFKSKVTAINDSIRHASSLADLQNAQSSIDQLRNQYVDKKELLDKSLYPLDFNKTFENLQKALDLRKGDFTQIDVLNTQVTGLKEQVDTLNKRNADLMSRVQLLEVESKKDKSRIIQLERSIADLKASLQKRDELVISMIDSLIPPSYRQQSVLSSQEKEKVLSEAEKNNVINNIKKSLQDNIKFLQVANLTPDDLAEIKRQQDQFAKVWRSVGPQLVNVYSENKAGTNDLKDIETYFASWKNALYNEAWESIRVTFADYGVNLQNFSNGKEFTESAVSFINDEIKNISIKGKEEAQNTYKNFADSAWFGEVKPTWVPYLIDNKMLTEAQRDSVDNKISEWKSEVYGGAFNWLYILIAALIIVVVVLLIMRRKPKTLPPPNQV
jgi:predicted  nucleic acid-binding Zn-ribbon protein